MPGGLRPPICGSRPDLYPFVMRSIRSSQCESIRVIPETSLSPTGHGTLCRPIMLPAKVQDLEDISAQGAQHRPVVQCIFKLESFRKVWQAWLFASVFGGRSTTGVRSSGRSLRTFHPRSTDLDSVMTSVLCRSAPANSAEMKPGLLLPRLCSLFE